MTAIDLPFAILGLRQSPMELFKGGGEIMWPIILLSFLTITVIVERIIFAIREARSREPEVVEKMLEKVEARDIDGAVALGKKSKDFVARILVYTLTHREHSFNNAFLRASNQELNRYQQGMSTLDTCITAAPLLGLLGTVTGMMKTFDSLGQAGGDIASASSQITGGVGEALIATAAGLIIAIAGLLPYNYMNAKIEEAKHDVSDVSNALQVNMKKSEAGV